MIMKHAILLLFDNKQFATQNIVDNKGYPLFLCMLPPPHTFLVFYQLLCDDLSLHSKFLVVTFDGRGTLTEDYL